LVKNVYSSFTYYESYGLDGEKEDKSVNAHNCRKSCLLSKMFFLHKLISLHKCELGLNKGMFLLFVNYAKAYLELTSVITDLQMYVLYLDEEQRTQILEKLNKHVEDKKGLSEQRKMKAQININKFELMF